MIHTRYIFDPWEIRQEGLWGYTAPGAAPEKSVATHKTRSQAVARIADRTASRQLSG